MTSQDPTHARMFDVLDATWAPNSRRSVGDWIIREGCGGGSRVSAASWHGTNADTADVEKAEQAMEKIGQVPLFMLRPGQNALDHRLQLTGYELIAPVRMMAAPSAAVADDVDLGHTVIPCTPILALQIDIWKQGGIGAPRIDVMNRVRCQKTALLARSGQDPVGTVFVAIHKGVAMIHALEVLSRYRRKGHGYRITKAAAAWALGLGAHTISLLVTRENDAAIALYETAGFHDVASYHYRIKRVA